MQEKTEPDFDILSSVLNLEENEIPAVVITVADVDKEHMSMNIMSKLETNRIIFILQEALLYLNIQNNTDNPMTEENNEEINDNGEEIKLDSHATFVESDQSLLKVDPEDMINGSIIDPIKSDK